MRSVIGGGARAPALRAKRLASALAAASLSTLWPGPPAVQAQALPGGLRVTSGQAQVKTSGSAMTVTNSAGAILDWQSFNIGSHNSVRFQQPGATSQVLNRVVGNDPSNILGQLSSNGRVWLLNPNGVLFGRDARVDVAGLVASTLKLGDNQWLAGQYTFAADGSTPAAEVVNLGEIRSTLGGRVALLGGSVRNEGLIEATGGQVLLAAGRSIDLVDTGTPHLTLRVSAPQGEALNLGTLSAPGGRIDVQAAVVNQQGFVRADALEHGPGGEVVLRAIQGSSPAVDSGTLRVGGTTSAVSPSGAGGRIELLGRQVALLDGASVDASGGSAGGSVYLGGGEQGRDASLPNAEAAYVAPGASLRADALQQGPGGRLVLWSDRATRAYGSFSAQGGPLGGDGGFIETSGGTLDARPRTINATAKAGRAGTWLLDPYDLTIEPGDDRGGLVDDGQGIFTPIGNDAFIGAILIENALLAGNNVTLTTGNTGSQAGDITMTPGTTINLLQASVPVTLALNAARDINLDGAEILAGVGSPLNVSLNAAGSGAGSVRLTDSRIATEGGNVNLSGVSYPSPTTGVRRDGVILGNSSITTGAGRIVVRSDALSLEGTTRLNSTAQGDAITVAGRGTGLPGDLNNPNIASFDNRAGAEAFDAPSGRWLVYADNPSADNFAPGGLANDFRQYNALYGSTPTAPARTDNGFLFALAPTFSLAGNPSKVYDGNTSITFSPTTGSGLAGGDQATFTSSAVTGAFADPGADTEKPIAPTSGSPNFGTSFTDANGRPVYGYALSALGSVLSATLSYRAQPASKGVGAPVPPLSGSVTGFVAGESLATATRGSATWSSPATAQSPAGNYAVQGSGLSAPNYVFVQDPGNSTALTVTGLAPSISPTQAVNVALAQSLLALQTPPAGTGPGQTQVLNVMPALQPGLASAGYSFRSLPLSSMSPQDVAALLAARDLYKQNLFAQAIGLLQNNPGLADLPGCPSSEQLETGECLIGDALKRSLLRQRLAAAEAAAAATAVSAAAAAAATPGATGAAAVPAPLPPPAVAAAPPPAPAPALIAKRRVVAAALPQIERKVAVLIGVDRFDDPRIPGLDNAVSDARAVGQLLGSTLGYETIVLPNASKKAVVGTLNRLAAEIGPTDSVVVYYAGHGELVPGTGLGYWQLADANADRPETWLSNSDIAKLMSQLGASQVALVSDSCYSGSLVPDQRVPASSSALDPQKVLASRAVVVMSSGGNEPVSDAGKDGHSPFASSLMGALQQVSKWQSGGNVFERVRFAVARQLPQRPRYGASVAAGHQAGADYLFEQRELDAVR